MKCKCCGQEIKSLKPFKKTDNKEGWIWIPELEIYVEKDVHHKDYSYDQLKEIYGKDFEKMLLTKSQVEVLDASKIYRKIFKMRTWNNDFFIQQYNEDNKKQGYVAVFCGGVKLVYMDTYYPLVPKKFFLQLDFYGISRDVPDKKGTLHPEQFEK